MNFYDKHCLPYMLDLACGLRPFKKQRRLMVPKAEGRVLEIGIGSGLNLPYYDPQKVEFIWGLEPSEEMRVKAHKNLSKSPIEVRWLDLPSEEIPLEDDSVDTVLLTYTLCTIPGWRQALQEMRRVLKPGGRLVFSEHGEAPDDGVRRWQERINPTWGKLFGGCNLNRPIPRFLEEGGFRIDGMEQDYIMLFKPAGYNYWGTATAR